MKSPRGDKELVVVRVTDQNARGIDSAIVIFSATGGTIQDTVRTDADGIARVRWNGGRSTKDVVVTAYAWAGKWDSVKVTLGRNNVDRVVMHRIRPGDRDVYDGQESPVHHWYQGRQVRRPNVVTFDSIPADANCERIAVQFKAYGDKAGVVPDTGYGKLYRVGRDTTRKCQVRFHWTLPSGVGNQVLRATLVGDTAQRTDYVARSRALPWIGVGLAQSWDYSFIGTSQVTSALKVVHKFPTANGDTLEVAYDSTDKKAISPKAIQRRANSIPVVAVNFPLILRLHWLRLSVGADINKPQNNWFYGFSVLQMTASFLHEDVGYDLHFVRHYGRKDVVTNPAECGVSPRVATTPDCIVRTRSGELGYGLMLMVNTSTVLEKLFAALTSKS